jgi:putative Mg2+ transporter-C (MgtC) family protein
MHFGDIMQRADVQEGLVQVGRLVLALVLGGLLGWDRERHDKPAGLRTHMLVSLGSASFVALGATFQTESDNHAIDATRVLQGVVGGLGFLGAGTIIQGRGHVSGLTTAASVWVVGGVGAAAGLGAYVLAVTTALLALPVLSILGKVEANVNPNTENKDQDVVPDQNASKRIKKADSPTD